MRTTINFAPDIDKAIRKISKLQKKSITEVVDEIMRRGLNAKAELPKKDVKITTFSLKVAPEYEGLTTKQLLDIMDEEYDRKKMGL